MNTFQTRRTERRDQSPPVVHGLTVDPEVARYGGTIALVKLEHIGSEHALQSTAVDVNVKSSGLGTIFSGLPQHPIGYRAMVILVESSAKHPSMVPQSASCVKNEN